MTYFTYLLMLICFYLWLKSSKPLIDSGGQKICPLYDSPEWKTGKRNCTPPINYHCAKDRSGKWREVCYEPTNCKKGEEPHITKDDRILCDLCEDFERYNPNNNTPSNEFSECPVTKTSCDKEKNRRIECVPAYDTSVSNASYKQERRCMCDYENGYMPRFYHDSPNFTCREAQELTCTLLHPPCPDGQKLQDDYRCHTIPTTPNSTLPNVTGSANSYVQTTSTPSRTTTFPTTTVKIGITADQSDIGYKIVIVILVVLVVGLLIFLVWRSCSGKKQTNCVSSCTNCFYSCTII